MIKRLCTSGQIAGCSSQGSIPGKGGRIGSEFLEDFRRVCESTIERFASWPTLSYSAGSVCVGQLKESVCYDKTMTDPVESRFAPAA